MRVKSAVTRELQMKHLGSEESFWVGIVGNDEARRRSNTDEEIKVDQTQRKGILADRIIVFSFIGLRDGEHILSFSNQQ